MADGCIKSSMLLRVPNWPDRTIAIYLPFPDAEFAAQRSLNSREWLIVHVRTTMLLPGFYVPSYPTREAALRDARRLSVECPSAARLNSNLDKDILARLAAEVRASMCEPEPTHG